MRIAPGCNAPGLCRERTSVPQQRDTYGSRFPKHKSDDLIQPRPMSVKRNMRKAVRMKSAPTSQETARLFIVIVVASVVGFWRFLKSLDKLGHGYYYSPIDRDKISPMPIDQVVSLLIAERDRLHRAIQILQDGGAKRRGRPPKNPMFNYNHPSVPDGVKPASSKTPVHRKRTMSAAGRKAIRDAVRKRWALIRAGKAASPFAKRKKAAKK
jgi:hypothetical protein